MTVVHVVDYFASIGGMKTHLYHLMDGLKKNGVSSIVVAPQKSRETGWDNKERNILWVNTLPTKSYSTQNSIFETIVKEIYPYLQDMTIDLIHGHTATGYTMGALLAYSLRCPIIITLHGGWAYFPTTPCTACLALNYEKLCIECEYFPGENPTMLENNLNFLQRGMYLAAAHRILVLNDNTYRHCKSFFGVPSYKLSKVKLWVDIPDKEEIKLRRIEARHHWSTHIKSKVILWAGTARPTKRFDIAYQAFIQLALENDDVEFWVAGLNVEEFANYCVNTPPYILSRIHCLGLLEREEMHLAYLGADIFWQPSIWESVSYVLLEAMAYCLPCIAVEGLNNSDFLMDSKNVCLVPPNNYMAFAKATNDMLLNPDKTAALGNNARAYVINNHNQDQCTEEMIKQYKIVINQFNKAKEITAVDK